MNKTTKQAVERFLKFGNKRNGGVFSRASVGRYRLDLNQFFSFIDKDFRKITDKDCDRFFDYLREKDIVINGRDIGRKLNIKSVYHKMTAVKAFFRYAMEHDLYKGRNPIYISIPQDRIKSSPSFIESQILSREEVRKLLDSVKTLRDKLILTLLYNTGMRIGELKSLDLGSVNMDKRTIRIVGKGSKERLIEFNDDVYNALKMWLMVRKGNSDALITGKFGARLNEWYIDELIRKNCIELEIVKKVSLCGKCREKEDKFCRKCKWDRRISAHSLRHTFICHAISDDARLSELSGYVGHSSIDMTLSYTTFTKLGNTIQTKFKGIHKEE